MFDSNNCLTLARISFVFHARARSLYSCISYVARPEHWLQNFHQQQGEVHENRWRHDMNSCKTPYLFILVTYTWNALAFSALPGEVLSWVWEELGCINESNYQPNIVLHWIEDFCVVWSKKDLLNSITSLQPRLYCRNIDLIAVGSALIADQSEVATPLPWLNESRPGYARKLPVTLGKVVVFDRYPNCHPLLTNSFKL